jgi:hypothetical protein
MPRNLDKKCPSRIPSQVPNVVSAETAPLLVSSSAKKAGIYLPQREERITEGIGR